MRRSRWILIFLFFAVILPGTSEAQDSTEKSPWLSAFSIGFPSIDGEMEPIFFTVGGNFTKVRAGSWSPDFSIGTMPIALTVGTVPWATRAGGALPMWYSPDVVILPSAGLSSIAVLGDDGAVFGINVGIAMANRRGARVGLTWHRFADTETIMLLEFGAGRLK